MTTKHMKSRTEILPPVQDFKLHIKIATKNAEIKENETPYIMH